MSFDTNRTKNKFETCTSQIKLVTAADNVAYYGKWVHGVSMDTTKCGLIAVTCG